VVAVGIAVVLIVVSVLPGWLSGRWAGEAETLLGEGALADAEAKARAALEVREENAQALRVLIEITAGTNNAEAILLSNRLMETGRADFEDRIQFTELAQAVGDIEGARPVIEQLKAERPTDPSVILLEARQAALDGESDLALQKVEDALSMDENNPKARLLRGLLLTRSADPVRRLQGKEALIAASRSEKRVGIEALMALLASDNLNIYPDERRSLADLLSAHPLAGIPEKLLALQNLIVSDPEGRSGYVSRATLLFSEKPDSALLIRWLIAIGEPESALERIPEEVGDDRIYFDARVSALMRLGRYDEVRQTIRDDTRFLSPIEKASIQIYLGPPNGDAEAGNALWDDVFQLATEEDRPDVLLNLAQYAQAQGQAERAVECYRAAFELGLGKRDSLALWQKYFLATLSLDDLEISREVAARIHDRYPEDPSSQNNLAYLSLLLDRDVEQARQMSEALVEAYPDAIAFRTTLALAYLKSGAADRAWTILEVDRIDWSGEEASSRIIVALTAKEAGHPKEALEYVAGIDPDDLLSAEREMLTQVR